MEQETDHPEAEKRKGMIGRIVHNLWSKQPLVLLLSVLVIVIIFLGVLLGTKQCSGGLYADKYLNTGVPDLELIKRLDSIVMKPQATRVYGLSADDYAMEAGQIERGETFSRLLNQKYNVPVSTVNRLVELCKGKFDLRDIRAGNNYTAFLASDSLQTLCYLVYERNRTDFITFGICDSVFVRVDRKETRTEERYAEGTINSSLYQTISDLGINISLADQMAKIFESTIDFFALQKGDGFRVLFEEQFIDTTSIGITQIYGIEFTHVKKPSYAFRFFQDNEYGYWDDKGVNLRGSFLLSPLKFNARVTSKFGVRNHPIRRIRAMHNGVDYACPIGTPVHAVADGVVSRRGWDSKGGGNFIWIRHAQGIESGYLHLSRFVVAQGTRVRQGQLIAYSGNTGGSTGPHLDYRLKRNGKFTNPLALTSMPKEPIKASNKAAFEQRKADVMKVLDSYSKK